MNRVNIAIVGTGGIVQKQHLPNYAKVPQARVVAVCDAAPGRAEQVAAQFGIARHFTDYAELVQEPDIDAVHVCAPNFLHAPITLAALRAGKHVLCEKPLATSAAAAWEMAETARQMKRTLMVGFNNRFRTDARILKKHIDAGDLGEIYYAKCGWLRRRGNPFGWFADRSRSGGGPLIDLGVHVLDLTRYLMGNPKPISVTGSTYNAFGGYQVDEWDQYQSLDAGAAQGRTSDVEDLATALIKFDNGATLMVDVSWALNIKQEVKYWELYGTKGGARLEPLEIYSQLHGHLADITPVYRDTASGHEGELRHFVHCLLKGEEPICPGEQGYEIALILDAIYESARSGREVRLDQPGGESRATEGGRA